ncbi:MAG: leucine-rich repeat protein [Oscillospiraceae bacterium]|nr:leucine-rich repeat protein [Oscillospiraceae bacterium]
MDQALSPWDCRMNYDEMLEYLSGYQDNSDRVTDYLDNSAIKINHAGSAFAYYQGEPNQTYILKKESRSITVRSNENGVFSVPLGNFDAPGTYDVKLTISHIGDEQLRRGIDLNATVHVTPLEFTQSWEASLDASVAGKLMPGVEIPIIKAKFMLGGEAKAEAGVGTAMKITRSHSADGDSLKIISDKNVEAGASVKAGISAEILTAEVELASAGLGVDGTGGVSYGIEIEDYDPSNLSQNMAVATYFLGEALQANPSNLFFVPLHEHLTNTVYGISGVTKIYGDFSKLGGTISANVGTVSMKYGDDDKNIVTAASFDYDVAISQSKQQNARREIEKSLSAQTSSALSLITGVRLNELEGDDINWSGSVLRNDFLGTDVEITAKSSSEGKSLETTSLSADVQSSGFILREHKITDYNKYKFQDQALNGLISRSDAFNDYLNGNSFLLSLIDVVELTEELSVSDVPIPYNVETKDQILYSVPIEFGFAAIVGAEFGVNLSYLEETSYEKAYGYAVNDEILITGNSDNVGSQVDSRTFQIEELFTEAIPSLANEVKNFFAEIWGHITDGVEAIWARITGKENSRNNWNVSLTYADGGNGRKAFAKSYRINTTKHGRTRLNSSADADTQIKASTIGRPVVVNVTDADTEEIITDFSEEPLEFTIRYAAEDLEAAGLSASDPIVQDNGIAIYRYSDNGDYFEYVGGAHNQSDMTVTATITKGGQYILAADSCAPAISVLDISDFHATPTITARFDDLSGMNPEYFVFKLDDEVKVDASNLDAHYSTSSGEFTYTVTEEDALDEGRHTMTFTLADTSGNLDSYTYSFNVDLTNPEILDVEITGYPNADTTMEILAEVADENLTGVYAVLSKMQEDGTWSSKITAEMSDLGNGTWGLDYQGDGNAVKVYVLAMDIAENTASSEEFVIQVKESEGTCGDNLCWELDDEGTLRIFGTGDMWSYLGEDIYTPWYEYRALIKNVVLEDGVSSIGDAAFAYCEEITDISIADTVESIGFNAIFGCRKLISITIPKSVTTISYKAINTCLSLQEIIVDAENTAYTSVNGVLFTKNMDRLVKYPEAKQEASYTIPEETRIIGSMAFTDCRLTEIITHDEITTIEYCAFANTPITSFTIPPQVTVIEGLLFQCSSLTSITIPVNITAIKHGAFTMCDQLEEIIFQGDAPEFFGEVFVGVTAVAAFPTNNETWVDEVFQNYGGTITWIGYEPEICDEHTWGDVEVIIDPGCTGVGEGVKTCLVCGAEETVILYGEHQWGEAVVVREAECFENGEVADGESHQICSVCGEVKVSRIYGRHTYETQVVAEATCTEDGERVTTCSVCGYSFSNTIPGGHRWDWSSREVIKEATCTEDGEERYTCSVCQETKIEITQGYHDWSDYEVIQEQTCTEDGIEQAICQNCGLVNRFTIEAEHEWDWSNGTVTREATCEVNGIRSYPCRNCDETHEVSIYEHHTANENGICTKCGKHVCGDKLSWSFDEATGTLTISGNGNMYWRGSDPSQVPWAAVRERIQHVVFSGNCGNIASNAFYGCINLTQITIPEGCQIGSAAFKYCVKLETVEMTPMGWIREDTFSGCTSLTGIDFSRTGSIEENAFRNCASLEEINFGIGLAKIEANAFAGCVGVDTVAFTGNAPEIGENAFGNVTADVYYPIHDITWTDEVRRDYGGDLTWIGDEAKICGENLTWNYNAQTKTLTISGTGEMYDYADYVVPWAEYQREVRNVVVEQGVTVIGSCAFDGMTSLINVEIADSVITIGDAVFRSCTSLTGLDLPENLKTMGANIFDSCTALESVEIPGTVTNMAYYSFLNCTSLQKVELPENLEPAPLWGMFSGCTSLTEVDVKCLEYIGWGMFEGCTSLTEIELGEQLYEVSDGAFAGCTSLAHISFPESLTNIGVEAFADCTSLTTVYFTGNAFWCYETEGNCFKNVTANVYYPADNPTWTPSRRVDYGGNLTWIPYYPGEGELVLMHDGLALEESMTVDMKDHPVMELSAVRGNVAAEVSWTTSDAKIAAVMDGEVTFRKPGNVTITARENTGESVGVTMDVFYVDPAARITAEAEIPEIGLQTGQQALIVVSGEQTIDTSDLIFASSNAQIASVDENGVVTGGSKTGTARITASIQDDPLKRKTTMNVKVIPAQISSLTLEPEEITLDKAELTNKESRTFVITPMAESEFAAVTLTNRSLKWTSSNTKLATVKANSDGSATMTIAANKDGVATITAQSTDLAKITATMTLTIYDRSPKLENSKITLNPMLLGGTNVILTPGYENEVRAVEIVSPDLTVDYDEETDILNVAAVRALKNGTINTSLEVLCENGSIYSLPLKVTVKSTVPSVTIKQTSKLDLFYIDSEAALTVTAKDAVVATLMLADTEDFVMDADGVIRFAEDLPVQYAVNPKYKPDTKATLLVYLEGYAHPVEKAITITTSATKLNLSTDPASSTVNTNSKFGADLDARFKLYNKTAKQILDLEGEDVVNVVGYDVDVAMDSNEVSLTLAEAKKATLTVSVQKENWMYPVTLKHNVAVTDKDPTVKLGKTTLKLNTKLPEMTDSTSAVLTNGNLAITGFDNNDLFVTTAKAGTDAWRNAQMIRVEYVNAGNGGDIVASIEPGQTPKAGTYTYTATPDIDGEPLKSVTIKVSVSSAEPKVTLGAKDKLDTVNPESRIVYTVNSVTNADGNLEDVVFEQGEDWFQISRLHRDSKGKQYFTMRLREDVTYSTKQTYKVVFSYKICGEWFTSNTLNIKVSQSNLKITASAAQYVPGQENVNVNLILTTPENARMEQVVINEAKTAKELIAALEESVLNENLLENAAAEAELTLPVADDSNLKPGRSYKLVLDITPVGHASDAKITTVTVNIKIAK